MATNESEQEASPDVERAQQRIRNAEESQERELSLAGLSLTKLPESLIRLTQLQRLSLARNQLTTLPESITQLIQLQQLSLHHNKNLGIPTDVLNAGPISSLVFYFSRVRQEARHSPDSGTIIRQIEFPRNTAKPVWEF